MKQTVWGALVVGILASSTNAGATLKLQFPGGYTHCVVTPHYIQTIELWLTVDEGHGYSSSSIAYDAGTLPFPYESTLSVWQWEIGQANGVDIVDYGALGGSPTQPPTDNHDWDSFVSWEGTADFSAVPGPVSFMLHRFVVDWHATGVGTTISLDLSDPAMNVYDANGLSIPLSLAPGYGSVTIEEIPEPGSAMLLAIGALAVLRQRNSPKRLNSQHL